MYVNGYWYYDKFETFEWGALWGNPDIRVGPPPVLSVMLPDGVPDYLPPGTPTNVAVQIVDGSEALVALAEEQRKLVSGYRIDHGEQDETRAEK
jgi:hypothetical protein